MERSRRVKVWASELLVRVVAVPESAEAKLFSPLGAIFWEVIT
jgi:hypothetical protein